MMERGGPALVPQWYKAANGGGSASSLNHSAAGGSSTHLGEHDSGTSSRSKLSVCARERDALRGSVTGDRSLSSSRGSSSTNGYATRDKDSHPYNNFGRSRRDRERELESRGRDRVRDKPSLVDNGSGDYSDLFKDSCKVRLRRSHSMVLGRQVESWTKRSGNDRRNGVVSGGSVIGGIGKSSFERDFPSLRAEEKPDRVSSPGISSAVQFLPIGSSTVIGGDGWTSALVNVPALQIPSATIGLNMAETLVQAPSRVHTPPQVSVDTQRIEELTLRQFKQLIPVTPSMPKTSVLNSSEKSKSKGARDDLGGPPKVGQQSSSQLVNHALRAFPRSDIPKISPAGNFQVLNRDKNDLSPTAKDVPTVSRAANSLSAAASAAGPPLRRPLSPKPKSDCKGPTLSSAQNYFGEKRPLSQAQNRNDFFNSLRKKTNNPSAVCQPSPDASSSGLEKSIEQSSAMSSSCNCSDENGNGVTGGFDACEGSEKFPSDNGENNACPEPMDEEEEALLRSLGWDKNARVEALTAEEIEAFVKVHGKQRPSLKLFRR